MIVYLSVGSNIQAELNLIKGLQLVQKKGLRVQELSTHYKTAPVLHKENPDYINGIWKLVLPEKHSSIDQVDQQLKDIELQCGRKREKDSYASRTLDLDIIIMGSYASEDILLRDFVHIPLLELEPEIVLPGAKKSLKDLIRTSPAVQNNNMKPLWDFTENLRSYIHG